MMITAAGAVGVYFLATFKLGMADTPGMAAGVVAAVLLSALFARKRKR
ncbi:hypothetical protein [Desulfotomaculum copahuensis]|nr:hypothetical protein [Desulfotomaculum copahuensis]